MATLQKIYSDLDLTFKRLPATNDVALRYDDQSVVASVRNLLLTNFYERPFQPNLGSNLNAILFEMADGITSGILEKEIRNVIQNYEPRVKINQLIISPSTDENSFNMTMSFFIGNNTRATTVNMLLQRSR
jgi:phage baseplate assembly protein W